MKKPKVVLIGLDGCDFGIIRPLIEDGNLPTFSEILKGGCYGTLISTLPPNTLPAWTSIFTGVNPGKHGITDFYFKEDDEFKIANSSHRMVDTLWTILTRFDLQQVIINEPVTYPPEKINGIMLTGFSTPYQSKNFAHPSSIRSEVNKVCQGYETDLPLGFEKIIAEDKTKGFETINEFATKVFKATKYLGTNFEWDLLSVTFTSTDRLQHFYFSDSHSVKHHYQLLDKFLREIINIESNANFILVSDHGFGPLKKCFYINTWLKQQNLVTKNQNIFSTLFSSKGLTYQDILSLSSKIKLHKLLAKITPSSIKRSIPHYAGDNTLNLAKSALISPGLNSGLFINDNTMEQHIPILVEKLSSLLITNERPIEKIFLQNEALWGPYTYRAADIFLIPRYGYEISQRFTPSCLSEPSMYGDIRNGTHRPKGIFVAFGPDINKGKALKEPLFTWDVTPTILNMLDLPIPKNMDGCVLKQIQTYT